MKGEIINVGTEILMGDITNTNAQYISKELANLGISIYYHTTVGDNPKRLKNLIKESINRSELVIITGGLGPTQDDLTKETVSEVLDLKLKMHKPTYDNIAEIFNNISCKMTNNNIKQAYLPEKSTVIPNKNGTAPGVLIDTNDKIIIMLPGPPRELIPMFQESVIPYLQDKSDIKFVSKYYKVTGIGESAVEDILIDIINNQKNPTIATYAKPGEVLLRVTANGKTKKEAELLIEELDKIIIERLGDNIYSNENISLNNVVAKQLIDNDITISIAESCTGGLIASQLTLISGISKCLHSGIVCYSNESKKKYLNVKEETLNNYGAVSSQTAKEMLLGLHKTTESDIIISTTGIAGPTGGTEEKPVGLVYIGIYYKGKIHIEKHNISGSRERIQNKAATIAFNLIRKIIKK